VHAADGARGWTVGAIAGGAGAAMVVDAAVIARF
jgi:hypothetical protein